MTFVVIACANSSSNSTFFYKYFLASYAFSSMKLASYFDTSLHKRASYFMLISFSPTT